MQRRCTKSYYNIDFLFSTLWNKGNIPVILNIFWFLDAWRRWRYVPPHTQCAGGRGERVSLCNVIFIFCSSLRLWICINEHCDAAVTVQRFAVSHWTLSWLLLCELSASFPPVDLRSNVASVRSDGGNICWLAVRGGRRGNKTLPPYWWELLCRSIRARWSRPCTCVCICCGHLGSQTTERRFGRKSRTCSYRNGSNSFPPRRPVFLVVVNALSLLLLLHSSKENVKVIVSLTSLETVGAIWVCCVFYFVFHVLL